MSDGGALVVTGGARRTAVTAADLADLAWRTVETRLDCTSGGATAGEWTGPAVSSVLEDVGVPDRTTHLRFVARDGQTACVGVDAALDGVLALARDEGSVAAPRFVAPHVAAVRAVKRVERIEAQRLRPGEAPEELEHLTTAE